ncbi:MAG: hypothetical protein Q9162_006029 [Coniocarpon cinnabarinum]
MEKQPPSDVEAGMPKPIPHFQQIFNQGVVTDDIRNWHYKGSGTDQDPYIVVWIDHDPRNPMLMPQWKKWCLVFIAAIATLAVSFASSAYSSGVIQIERQFGISEEVTLLGVSLFVVGFAIGPLLWAPLSELYGRQYLFFGTYMAFTAFNAGAAGSKNSWTLIILRFFAGAFGSSPLTNAGGLIADMFAANQRGVALPLFAAAAFLGPALGPIVGGFVGQLVSWQWIEGVIAIFSGVVWIAGGLCIPETYPPVLLRQRAMTLTKETGKIYKSQVDADQGKVTLGHAFKTSLSRPWILLLREPIVLLLSIYMAIIYGTLYLLFAAFPIVYQEYRGWSQGIGGLAFLGVMVGMLLAVCYAVWDNKRYIRAAKNDPSGFAPPEARLPPCLVGSLILPIGLFWFAWTNSPSISWVPSVIAGAPFGFGMVLVFLSIMNYLIDAYVIFAASVLAANSVLRSLFGAIFPLFTTYMYENLGIHWASSIPAFLALACVPFPFLFYRYGYSIRVRCKFAAEADLFLKKMRGQVDAAKKDLDESSSDVVEGDVEKERNAEKEDEREQEAYDYSYDDDWEKRQSAADGRFQKIKTGQSTTSLQQTKSHEYEASPFDLDRTNTKESFSRGASRNASRNASRMVSRTASRTASPTRSVKSKKSNRSLRKQKSSKSINETLPGLF